MSDQTQACRAADQIVAELRRVTTLPWSCTISRFITDWTTDPTRHHFKLVTGYVFIQVADLPYALNLDFDLLTFWSTLTGLG